MLYAELAEEAGVVLAGRLRARDEEALGQLYDRYGRAAYIRIYHLVRNETVAEDLLQETFLQVWNRFETFDRARGSLGSWILQIARHRAIDYLRSREAHVEANALSLDVLEREPAEGPRLPDAPGFRLFGALRTGFAKLTEHQRTVLELAYVEGMSHSEMAEQLQRPLGTIKTWVRSALDSLRVQVVDGGPPGSRQAPMPACRRSAEA